MSRKTKGVAAAALGALALVASEFMGGAGFASSPGKQIRMIVGMPPGGGVDAYARLLQRHMVRHLPNEPSLIVQNLPGAGSLRSVMALANSTQEADLSIATFSSSLLTEAIVNPSRVKVDFRDFAFLGNVAEDSRVCFVTAQSGVSGLKGLGSRKPLTFGATAAGTSGNLDVAILQKLLGVRLNLVLGYAGSAEKRLALERGEIDGDCAGATSVPEDWLKTGRVNVVIRFSPVLPPGIDARVPFGGDLVSAAEREVYDFLVTPQQLGRLFMVSRKIPQASINMLRQAFDATMKDSEFLQEAARMGLLVTATSGLDVDLRVATMYGASPEVVARAKAIMED